MRKVIIEKYGCPITMRFPKGLIWQNDNEECHRYNDYPAVITNDLQMWFVNGLRHRKHDLPAIIRFDNVQHLPKEEYWFNDKLHREGDKPVAIFEDGSFLYAKEGVFHRDGDRPAYYVIKKEETRFYKEGKLHRENNKPAVILKKKESFFENGLHIKTRLNYGKKISNFSVYNPFYATFIVFIVFSIISALLTFLIWIY